MCQFDQEDTAQSVGQLCMLHCRCSKSGGQPLPPESCGTTILRCLCWMPAPHVCEHPPQSPNDDTVQSTAHACSLQARVRPSTGHVYPPLDSLVTTLRVCDCVPVPHDLLQ